MDAEISETESSWRHLPYLLAMGVLALPAWIIGGLPAALLLLVSVAIVMTIAGYQILVRREAFLGELDEVEHVLHSMPPPRMEDRSPAPAH